MAYLNTTTTDFFASDLESGKFILVKNQGVSLYIDYEVKGLFSGRGALRFQNFVYSTPQRIFQVYADMVFPPLKIIMNALKFSQPNEWSGKEIRVKVLVMGDSGSDGSTLFDLGGDTTNTVRFEIGRFGGQMRALAELWVGGVVNENTSPITFLLGSWHLVDFQAKIDYLARELKFKVVVYPVIFNADGIFNSLGTPIGIQTLSIGSIPSPDTLWGINPFEVQGYNGNPVGILLDNLSIGQGEGITEL
jgi:hypothetical protein